MLTRKDRLLFFIPNIVLPLILGAFLYYLFRPAVFLSQCLYKLIRIDISLELREVFKDSFLGEVLHCYAADFLWAYSVSMALMWIREVYHRSLWQTIIICICTDIAMELLQLLPFIGGVFDVIDILVQISATVIVTVLVLGFTYLK